MRRPPFSRDERLILVAALALIALSLWLAWGSLRAAGGRA